jgi:hypothetical protein
MKIPLSWSTCIFFPRVKLLLFGVLYISLICILFYFIMLVYESATMDGSVDSCPAGLCPGPSGVTKGGCARDWACAKDCHKEGFETGFCAPGFWTGACKCCKPCVG